MSETFTIDIKGMDQLKKELDEFSKNMQRKATRFMCFKGAEVIKKEAAKNITPADTAYWSYIKEEMSDYAGMDVKGTRKISGKAYRRTMFSPGWVARNIWIGKAKKQPRGGSLYRVFLGDKAWFGRFIEYGFSLHGVRHPARPFLRPALSSKKTEAVNAMYDALRTWLAREWGRGSNRILKAKT